MLIFVFVLLLGFVTVIFLDFVNFQAFLEKLETRSKIWPCQYSQQRANTSYEFSRETALCMKGDPLFPNRDFTPN
jgi:hypothetical protein